MKSLKQYTMKELSAFVNMTARNIRFYIQQGVVDKPEGANKGAYYIDKHLQQLLIVKKYKENGVSLERIAQIIHQKENSSNINFQIPSGNIEVISRIYLHDGVELTINPERSGFTQADIRELSKTILQTIKKIKQGKNNNE
jgi:DNA-binding transcriptional MerR regulator